MANSENVWTRPKNVPYPSVWTKFEGKKPINSKIPKFWIQDILEEEFEVMVQILITHFCNEEPMGKYSNIKSDKESMNDLLRIWRTLFADKLGIVCYTENPDLNGQPIIAGLNCTCITSKNAKYDYQAKGKTSLKILAAVDYVVNQKDPFEILGVDHLLYALGLYVLPAFRGQGLGERILNAREPLCKAVGLKGTITTFTSIASQIIAEKVGFKLLSEEYYEDIRKSNPSLEFPGIEKHTEKMKYMYKMYS